MYATKKEWRKIIGVFLAQRTILAAQSATGMSYGRTQKMAVRIRIAMMKDVPEPFSGVCEADETFVGGKWKNKPRHLRNIVKPKRGHGTEKLPVVGVYSRSRKQVAVRVVEVRNEHTVIGFIVSRLAKDAVLYTDGYKMNRAVRKHGIPHEYVNHHLGEFKRGDVHTNSIEGFWGYLKKHLALIGGVSRTRMPIFVGELAWRFNHRTLSMSQKIARILERL